MYLRFRSAFALGASCVVALAASTSITQAAPVSGDPVEIPAILPLTGPTAFLGKSEQSALALVEDLVNKAGGISGRPVKFAVQDDQSDPQLSVQLYNGIAAAKPAVIIGPAVTATCGAIAPLLKDGPVLYCLSPGVHPDKGSWAYSWGIVTTEQIAADVRYFRERGFNKIALLTSTDASGQDGERSVDAALAMPENRAVTLVGREHYAVSDLSVSAQVSRIKASGAQALIAWGTGTSIGTIFHATTDANLDIPVAISAANLLYPIMKQFAAILPKQLVSSAFAGLAPDLLPNGPAKTAAMQYMDSFKAVGVRADASQVIGWDPAWIVVGAYRKLGPGVTARTDERLFEQAAVRRRHRCLRFRRRAATRTFWRILADGAMGPQQRVVHGGQQVRRWPTLAFATNEVAADSTPLLRASAPAGTARRGGLCRSRRSGRDRSRPRIDSCRGHGSTPRSSTLRTSGPSKWIGTPLLLSQSRASKRASRFASSIARCSIIRPASGSGRRRCVFDCLSPIEWWSDAHRKNTIPFAPTSVTRKPITSVQRNARERSISETS